MNTNDYWSDLAFAYLTTYSYGLAPGLTFEENRLFLPGRILNPTAKQGSTYQGGSPEVIELARLFRLPAPMDYMPWMCRPYFEHAICFFCADGRMIEHFDICMNCGYLRIDGQLEQLGATDEFFDGMRNFFRRAGHDVGRSPKEIAEEEERRQAT